MNISVIYGSFLIFFFVIWYKYLKVSSLSSCEESANTVRPVKRCPTDPKSWEMAAKNMDCGAIKQNCSQSTYRHYFQYHCVINAWMNETLEVCALNRTIFGMITCLVIYSILWNVTCPDLKGDGKPNYWQHSPPKKKKKKNSDLLNSHSKITKTFSRPPRVTKFILRNPLPPTF